MKRTRLGAWKRGFSVLLGVVILVFFLFQGLGDPARMVAGQSANAKTLASIRAELNLDEPVWKQLAYYLNDVSPLCIHHQSTIPSKQLQGVFIGGPYKVGLKIPYLRTSYQTKQPVAHILAEALPGTMLLAGAAILFALTFGLMLGVTAAVNAHSWWDRWITLFSVTGISLPSFFVALVIAYLFGVVWHSYTGLPLTGSWYAIDDQTGEKYLTLRNLVLPALTLGIRPLALITQITRSAMLDVLNQDYLRTARASGVPRWKQVWVFGLKNALNPVVTAVTGWFAELLAGAFFVEYIFGWHGLGRITVHALDRLDYPVVMGAVLLSATLFLTVTMLTEWLYRRLDPRVR